MTNEELIAKVEAMEKKVDGAETLLQQHKTEMGEARKQIKEAIEATSNLAKQEELKNALDKITEIEESLKKGSVNNQGRTQETEEKTLEEVRKSVQAAAGGNKIIDEAWQELKDEEKAELWGSKEKLANFLQAASELPEPVPGSLLSTKTTEGNELDRMRDLFKKVTQGHVHGSARGEITGYAGTEQEEQFQSRRLPDGVIPRPKSMT